MFKLLDYMLPLVEHNVWSLIMVTIFSPESLDDVTKVWEQAVSMVAGDLV